MYEIIGKVQYAEKRMLIVKVNKNVCIMTINEFNGIIKRIRKPRIKKVA